MKTLLAATALCGAMISASVLPAGAQDINIYVQGDSSGEHRADIREGGGRHMHHKGGKRRWGGDRYDREGRSHRSGRHERRGGHDHRLKKVLRLIERYNEDGDDRVTQAEIDGARAGRLAAFDSDGNGTLSLQEYEALWLDAMRERMVDRFQSHDDDGDGQVTADEFSERTSHLVLRMDRNGDGAISVEDARSRRDGRMRKSRDED